ncbi:MAG: protein-export chaperone SecB [Xanthomonadales bacterium]|nr:protein-export chaperone SecB [Xanthomonadales bacterium]
MSEQPANGAAPAGPQLLLQKIYVKDASFEAPHAPQVFAEQGQSQVELHLGQRVAQVGEGTFEVVLTATVNCTLNGRSAYLVEVHQAGIFTAQGFAPEQLDAVLGSYCPHVLFPYLRQTVSDLVLAGGFPPLLLQPINFEQIYAEALRRRAAEAAGAGAPAPAGRPEA